MARCANELSTWDRLYDGRGTAGRIGNLLSCKRPLQSSAPLAGAHIENGNPKILLFSMLRLSRFLPAAHRQEFLQQNRCIF